MSFKCGIESLVFTIILMNQTLANVVCAGLNEERCPNYNHSSNVMVLMDSWEYQNLLLPNKGAVWTQFDKDMKKPVIKWVQTSNRMLCQQSIQVQCENTSNTRFQDNWLITQMIRKNTDGSYLAQVKVLIEFEALTSYSKPILNVYKYELSAIDEYWMSLDDNIVDNFSPVQSLLFDSSFLQQNRTITLKFDTNETSFYFAIRHRRGCVAIHRIVVFYNVCPTETVQGTYRPETIAPIYSHEVAVVKGKCIEHYEPENGFMPYINCLHGGYWSSINGSGCTKSADSNNIHSASIVGALVPHILLVVGVLILASVILVIHVQKRCKPDFYGMKMEKNEAYAVVQVIGSEKNDAYIIQQQMNFQNASHLQIPLANDSEECYQHVYDLPILSSDSADVAPYSSVCPTDLPNITTNDEKEKTEAGYELIQPIPGSTASESADVESHSAT